MKTIDERQSQPNTLPAHSCCQGASGKALSIAGWSGYLPTWLRGKWGLLVGCSALAVGGAALGWPWLVAIGIAPILLAAVACAVMCTLGLCMMEKHANSAGSKGAKTGASIATLAPSPLSEETAPSASPQQVRERERIAPS